MKLTIDVEPLSSPASLRYNIILVHQVDNIFYIGMVLLYKTGLRCMSRHRKGRQGESKFFIYESNRHVDEEEDEGVHHMYAFAQ